MKDIVRKWNAWKAQHDDDYVYDEVHNFVAELDRCELCSVFDFIAKLAARGRLS